MIRLALLIAIATALPAMDDWSLDPALHRDDRQGHAVAGLVIGSVSAALIESLPATRDWKPWQKIVASTLVATAAGVVKELADARDPESHCTEVGDVTATALGGAAGAVTLVWRF